MISIRNKKYISEHPYMQIWREPDQDCSYVVSWIGYRIKNPDAIKLKDKMYTGKYMIEMTCGANCANPDDYQ